MLRSKTNSKAYKQSSAIFRSLDSVLKTSIQSLASEYIKIGLLATLLATGNLGFVSLGFLGLEPRL